MPLATDKQWVKQYGQLPWWRESDYLKKLLKQTVESSTAIKKDYAGKPVEALKKGETIEFGPDGKRGVWRNIGGSPIFIEVAKGESIPQAVKRQTGIGGGNNVDSARDQVDPLRAKARAIGDDEEAFGIQGWTLHEKQWLSDPQKPSITSKDGVNAIKTYTGTDHFVSINETLRASGKFTDIHPPSVSKQAEILNHLATQKLSSGPMIVYRGVSGDLGKTFSKHSVGDVVEMKGLTSTSLNPRVASTFLKKPPYLLEIKAKRGLYVREYSEYKEEFELLQAHGTKYRLVGVKKAQHVNGVRTRVNIVELEEI